MDDPSPADLVERLLGEQFDGTLKKQIKSLGEAAVPSLLAALRDPRFQSHRYKTSHSMDDRSALVTILSLLEPFAPAAAVPTLAGLVRSDDTEMRKQAALALGNIANDDCVAPLSAALRDENEYVVSYALMGIEYATRAARCSPGFVQAMLGQTAPLLESPLYNIHSPVPRVLLALDKEKGTALLLGDKVWTVENVQGLEYIVDALAKCRADVPAERLLDLERQLRPLLAGSAATIVKFEHARAGGKLFKAYEHLLLLLAQRKAAGTREICLQAKKSFPDLRAKATKALAILKE